MGPRISPTCSFMCIVLFLNFSGQINSEGNNKMIDAINSFGLDLYKELSKVNENLVCSGYSASTVLNMLLAGAGKGTEQGLRKVLNYDKFGLTRNQTQIEDAYHETLSKQRDNQNGFELYVANSLWIHSGFTVLPKFKNTIKSKFYSVQQEVDFLKVLSKDKINSWVSKETKDKIPKLFDIQINPLSRIVLVNAIYCKGTWKNKFTKTLTTPHPFKLDKGDSKKDVQMMVTGGLFPYHDDRNLDAQVLELPYDGDQVSMIVFLPKVVNGLSRLQELLTLKILTKTFSKLKEEEINVKIPKFKISSTLPLKPVLESLGMKQAFTKKADLSGINGKRDLFVSDAIQKAIIEVNEEGTVASAVSGVISERLSTHTEDLAFTADHPFMYFIRHKPTGLILFVGRMTQP